MDSEWPWETLRAEQEARPGTFTASMRQEYRWDDEAFTRLEEAMRAACEVLDGDGTIERWVGEGFWCWTAVIPELTEHPRFQPPDPHVPAPVPGAAARPRVVVLQRHLALRARTPLGAGPARAALTGRAPRLRVRRATPASGDGYPDRGRAE